MKENWRKSSHSGSDLHNVNDESYCVECGNVEHSVGIRDTKNPNLGHLQVSKFSFAQLLNSLKE
jgi:hypothetical protein